MNNRDNVKLVENTFTCIYHRQSKNTRSIKFEIVLTVLRCKQG